MANTSLDTSRRRSAVQVNEYILSHQHSPAFLDEERSCLKPERGGTANLGSVATSLPEQAACQQCDDVVEQRIKSIVNNDGVSLEASSLV